MFIYEWVHYRLAKRSIETARNTLLLDHPKTLLGHPKTEAIHLDGEFGLLDRNAYAQNEAYLEIVNPSSNNLWAQIFIMGWMLFGLLVFGWLWYGMGVHPLLFQSVIFMWKSNVLRSGELEPALAFGWLLGFPIVAFCSFILYNMLWQMGGFTMFFHPLRGRIRFNRITRKVYVLRPDNCGGNVVLDWDRMVAILNWTPPHPIIKREHGKFYEGYSCLVLYHPADDPNDPNCKGEDAVMVGVNALADKQTLYNWEYIRRYMEDGPGNNGIPKHIPHNTTTFCGMRSGDQFCLETGEGITSYWIHLISQGTCWWPKFPKEWNSDSGLGEPEDRPVQTGAVMTALVYRAEGKLSKEDEALLMQAYGADAK